VINTFARLHRLIIGSSKQQKLISVFFKASTHNLGVCRACPCVLFLSIRMELLTGWEMLLITPQAFLTNTHADSQSLLRISACAVPHTPSCLEVIQVFRYSLGSVHKAKNTYII